MNNRRISRILLVGIFLFMLLCNALTDLVADDFIYLFSFENDERITSVFQIFGSIKAHADSMNGRLLAHFFAQLFLLLPKWVFNIVNALVLTVSVWLMSKIANQNKLNPWIVAGIFSSLWIFSPSFGQVYLWLDGACNYLWSYFFGLSFIIFYVKKFVSGKEIKHIASKIMFLILAFMMGAYSENCSAAYMCTAFLILAVDFVLYKKKPKVYEILGLAAAFCGNVTIYLAPAQWANKAAELSLQTMRINFIKAVEMYKRFTPVLILFVILLVVAIYHKVDRKHILLSLSFLAGSLVANFMMMLASYYEARSAVSSLVILIAAAYILLAQILKGEYKLFGYCLHAVLFLCMVYHMCIGLNDIYHTNREVRINKYIVEQSKEAGVMDVELNFVTPQTEYSAYEGQRYLAYDPAIWPNNYMARYYEVDSIRPKAD